MQGVRHVLYEMFYNITDNAIRYTPDGGDVKVFVGKLNGKPYFRVEDNGIGIPESEQQRIFERFYRVDKARSREAGGSGLGLSIVHDAVVLHGGTICEHGTFDDLMARRGMLYSLYTVSQADEKPA